MTSSVHSNTTFRQNSMEPTFLFLGKVNVYLCICVCVFPFYPPNINSSMSRILPYFPISYVTYRCVRTFVVIFRFNSEVRVKESLLNQRLETKRDVHQ